MSFKNWYGTLLPFEAKALTREEIFQAGAASRDAEIEEYASVLLKIRKTLCGSINNTGDILELAATVKQERDQLREQVALLREEVTRCRDWFEAQAKVKSKGSPSSWELVLLRDERDAADEALAATEPKIAKPS